MKYSVHVHDNGRWTPVGPDYKSKARAMASISGHWRGAYRVVDLTTGIAVVVRCGCGRRPNLASIDERGFDATGECARCVARRRTRFD